MAIISPEPPDGKLPKPGPQKTDPLDPAASNPLTPESRKRPSSRQLRNLRKEFLKLPDPRRTLIGTILNGQWTVHYGSGNLVERKLLHQLYSAVAAKAAVAAGLSPSQSDDPWRDAWLDALRHESPLFHRIFGITFEEGIKSDVEGGNIENLVRASADYCYVLESRAFVLEKEAMKGMPAAPSATEIPASVAGEATPDPQPSCQPTPPGPIAIITPETAVAEPTDPPPTRGAVPSVDTPPLPKSQPPAPHPVADKTVRDLASLRNPNTGELYETITVAKAAKYSGRTEHQIRALLRAPSPAIESIASGPNRRVLVQSLIRWYPPTK